MRSASASTKPSSSAGGSARFSQPQRSATSAGTSSQPSTISSARARPTRRGRRCVPPPPGMMPSATSGCASTQRPSAPKRMSHESASSLPPPRAMPASFAIVAFGIVRRRSTHGVEEAEPVRLRPRRRVGSVWISATSACATKNSGFALWKTTTRTASSRPSASIAPKSSFMSVMSSRLIGGWSIVTHATPSRASTRSAGIGRAFPTGRRSAAPGSPRTSRPSC